MKTIATLPIATILLLGLLLPLALASCNLGPANDTQLIFRISPPTNAHAELWNGTGDYTEEICYNDPNIFSTTYDAPGDHHLCGANGVLRLWAPTNAHVQAYDWPLPIYPEQVCFGDLVCDIVGPDGFGVPRPCTVFNPAAKCLATISATTNAHVSSVCTGPGSYPFKVCCSSAVAVPNTAPIANADGPYVITLPTTTTVNLDGSGSMDDDDCGVGVTPCPMLNYAWAIINNPIDSDPNCSAVANDMQPSINCTAEGSADVTLTVTDSGSLFDTAATTITCGAGNSPPIPKIDTPDEGISRTVGTPINFTGHGEDPDGDIVDRHVWNCSPLGDCPAGFPFNVYEGPSYIGPGNIFFEVGTYTISYNVRTEDGIWGVSADKRTITILAPSSEPYLKFTLFSAEPFVFPADVAPDFTKLDIRVKNYGGAVSSARTVVGVRQPLTNESLPTPLTYSVRIGSGEEYPHNFESLDISSLPPSAYKLVAEVYNDDVLPPELHDSKALYFTIGKPVPVPELGLLLLPLIAFSVLAAILLSGKKN